MQPNRLAMRLLAILAVVAFWCKPAAATLAPLPDTTNGIHLGQAFNFNVPNVTAEVGVIDFVWSAAKAQPAGVYNTYYYPYDRNLNHYVGQMLYNLAWFKQNHPDWIIYTCKAAAFASQAATPDANIAWAFGDGDAWVPLDITNPAVLQFMFSTYIQPAIQSGYQGIAFDNVGLQNSFNRCGIWRNGAWVQLFSGARYNDTAFMNSVFSWAKWANQQLHAINASVVMNVTLDFNLSTPQATLDKVARYADTILVEDGSGYFGNGTAAAWLMNTNWFVHLQSLGIGLFLLNYVPAFSLQDSSDSANIQWDLANYLLVKGKHCYFVGEASPQLAGQSVASLNWIRPEFSAPIGSAVNSMSQQQNVYMRDFSNGKVIVNPSMTNAFPIALPANTYKDLYGSPVNSFTIGIQSAIVLLKK